jgi:hypothetical protein
MLIVELLSLCADAINDARQDVGELLRISFEGIVCACAR